MNRIVDLLGYLPLFLQQYRELQAIMMAENPEFQFIGNDGRSILDDTFIQYCDLNTISRFESMMGLYPEPGDTLEMRQTRVLSRWNDITPYTMLSLLAKLIAIQGNDDLSAVFDGSTYTLTITTRFEQQGMQEDLAYLLHTTIPCNLAVVSINNIHVNVRGKSCVAASMSTVAVEFITNDIYENLTMGTANMMAATITGTEIIGITTE